MLPADLTYFQRAFYLSTIPKEQSRNYKHQPCCCNASSLLAAKSQCYTTAGCKQNDQIGLSFCSETYSHIQSCRIFYLQPGDAKFVVTNFFIIISNGTKTKLATSSRENFKKSHENKLDNSCMHVTIHKL